MTEDNAERDDVIRFTLDGQDYEFEPRMSVKEARMIKRFTKGMGVSDLLRGIPKGDPDSWCAMVFLAKRRAGEAVSWQQLEELDLMQLMEESGADEEEYRQRMIEAGYNPDDPNDMETFVEEQAEMPDPTKAAGTTQNSASSTTSARSRSTSTKGRGT